MSEAISMSYPHTPKLQFPLEKYRVNSYGFHEDCTYNGVHWGIHLGEDVNRPAGTSVGAVGRGRVVYSGFHPGTKEKGNWGNIIIIAHKHPRTKKIFFSLYAHMQKRLVKKGERVEAGQRLGIIGKRNTPENGWWKEEHLHFAIYTGPKENKIPAGYWKKGSKRTKLAYWKEPTKFIKQYRG